MGRERDTSQHLADKLVYGHGETETCGQGQMDVHRTKKNKKCVDIKSLMSRDRQTGRETKRDRLGRQEDREIDIIIRF